MALLCSLPLLASAPRFASPRRVGSMGVQAWLQLDLLLCCYPSKEFELRCRFIERDRAAGSRLTHDTSALRCFAFARSRTASTTSTRRPPREDAPVFDVGFRLSRFQKDFHLLLSAHAGRNPKLRPSAYAGARRPDRSIAVHTNGCEPRNANADSSSSARRPLPTARYDRAEGNAARRNVARPTRQRCTAHHRAHTPRAGPPPEHSDCAWRSRLGSLSAEMARKN